MPSYIRVLPDGQTAEVEYRQRECSCRTSVHPGFTAAPNPRWALGLPRPRCRCDGNGVVNTPLEATA